MLTELQYRLLKAIRPGEPPYLSGRAFAGKSKLRTLLGDQLLEDVRGKVVLDFGCGEGRESVELAKSGARKVIGVDIQQPLLERARQLARDANVSHLCEFTNVSNEKADLVVTVDTFEHFAEPEKILATMHNLLAPNGLVLASFGPTWYHPLGGHLFSVFPWAHLLFSEKALIRWRNDLRSDGAQHFGEVEGGLNQMTIARFVRIVKASGFRLDALEAVPIRRLEFMHNRLTREFTTAIVRAKLRRI